MDIPGDIPGAVHLVRTYCIPILTYDSEIWHITESEKCSLNVLWNNNFRKIFNCCWKESPFRWDSLKHDGPDDWSD